jgi:hypothetical protein
LAKIGTVGGYYCKRTWEGEEVALDEAAGGEDLGGDGK